MSKVVPNPYLFNKIYIHSTLVPEIYAQFTFHFQFERLTMPLVSIQRFLLKNEMSEGMSTLNECYSF